MCRNCLGFHRGKAHVTHARMYACMRTRCVHKHTQPHEERVVKSVCKIVPGTLYMAGQGHEKEILHGSKNVGAYARN